MEPNLVGEIISTFFETDLCEFAKYLEKLDYFELVTLSRCVDDYRQDVEETALVELIARMVQLELSYRKEGQTIH